MKFECRMSVDLFFNVEADNEEQAMEYLNTHDMNDVLRAYAKNGVGLYQNYDDDVCGIVNDDEFAISAKE